MQVVSEIAGGIAAFLRLPRSGNHHDLGLFRASQGDARKGSVGLYHLAWQVDTVDELAESLDALRSAGALTGASDHGATKSIYGADPDGNEFEIMWMLPRSSWGHYENTAVIEPLDLPAELRRWSGVRTASEATAADQ